MTEKKGKQAGYMLLSVMLMMAVILLVLSIELPRIAQEIKREKEQELVNRGKEYATAIKHFYHKNGTYPVSLDQLESTNGLRYLRKRFKDPMTESGEFKLVHLGEAQINLTAGTGIANNQTNGSSGNSSNSPFPGNPTQGSTTPGSPTSTASPGMNSGSSGFGSGGLGSGSFGSGSNSGPGAGGLGSGGLGSSGLGSGSQPAPGGTAGTAGAQAGGQPGAGQMGSLTTQNLGNGMAVQGGGPIIGVVSTSKKTSIKEFNNNNEYDQWLFVYDPRGDQAGTGGVMVASPIGSGTSSPDSSGIPQPVQPVRTSTPSTPQ